MTRRELADERGSVLPLILVFFMIGLSAVYVLTAATSLALERTRLLTVADSVALSAAESFSLSEVAFSESGPDPKLDSARVAQRAGAALAEIEAATSAGYRLVDASTPDGSTALVTITGSWTPPLTGALLPDGVAITVSSTGRVVLS